MLKPVESQAGKREKSKNTRQSQGKGWSGNDRTLDFTADRRSCVRWDTMRAHGGQMWNSSFECTRDDGDA